MTTRIYPLNYELIASNNNGKLVYFVESIDIVKEWLSSNWLNDYKKITIKRVGVK